jgi:hypothetical protein
MQQNDRFGFGAGPQSSAPRPILNFMYLYVSYTGRRKLIGGWEGGLNKNKKGGVQSRNSIETSQKSDRLIGALLLLLFYYVG